MTAQTITFQIEQGGERLDLALAQRHNGLSRAQVQRLIKAGEVLVNGRASRPAYRLEPGDSIVVHVPDSPESAILPESVALDVLFEDAHLLVVNKPAGMVVHPAFGHSSGTLVNALLAHSPDVADVGGLERAGIVHRLDRDTSGLLLVAKDEETRTGLQRQFKRRQVAKTYLALVEGEVEPREGVIEAPVGRDKRQRKRMAVISTGRDAVTTYRALEVFANHTLLEVKPHTGRTHQVRVHLSWLGYPLVGDAVYGFRHQRLLEGRHFLHAWRVSFTHPVTGELLNFEAPLPAELDAVLRQLRPGRRGRAATG